MKRGFALLAWAWAFAAIAASPFTLRDTNWNGIMCDRAKAERLGLNGNFAVRGWMFDRALSYAHTFGNLVPAAWYFPDHPEYFAFVDGERIRYGQLCLSNPDVLKLCVERVKERMRAHPESVCFGVSQNDCDGWCECPECAAVRAKSAGTEADAVIAFVNKIAAAVKDEFPGKCIATLAYQKSRQPPTMVKPAANVIVCLCPIECDFGRPFSRSGYVQDVGFVRDLEGWAKLGAKLMIWDYSADFHYYQQGFPDLEPMAENLRLYRDNGVWGVFEQGVEETPYGWFGELKERIIPQLLNDPDADLNGLLASALSDIYGPAAPAMRQYYDRWCAKRDEIAADDMPYTIWCAPTDDYFPMAFYAELDKSLQAAASAANDTRYAAAVATARFWNDVLWGAQGEVEAARRAQAFAESHPCVKYNESYLQQHDTRGTLRRVVRAADEFDNPVITGDWPDPTVWAGGDGWYYSLATPVRRIKRSRNLVEWEDMDSDPLSPMARTYLFGITQGVWAPSVIKIGDKWNLYVALFVSGDDNRIEVLQSDKPCGPFDYMGNIIDSRREQVRNAIDPFVVQDGGRTWMFFGSCQGGIHRIELTADGLHIFPGSRPVRVAGLAEHPGVDQWGVPGAWEGAYVFRRGDWWYMFASGGKYSDGTYHLVVGRSDRVDGVFYDREGHPLTEGLAKPVLSALPRNNRFSGPGHNGDIFIDKAGQWWIFFHAHDSSVKRVWQRPTLLQRLYWTEDGWPYFEHGKPSIGGPRPKL